MLLAQPGKVQSRPRKERSKIKVDQEWKDAPAVDGGRFVCKTSDEASKKQVVWGGDQREGVEQPWTMKMHLAEVIGMFARLHRGVRGEERSYSR